VVAGWERNKDWCLQIKYVKAGVLVLFLLSMVGKRMVRSTDYDFILVANTLLRILIATEANVGMDITSSRSRGQAQIMCHRPE
jgi:hypothetical protein